MFEGDVYTKEPVPLLRAPTLEDLRYTIQRLGDATWKPILVFSEEGELVPEGGEARVREALATERAHKPWLK